MKSISYGDNKEDETIHWTKDQDIDPFRDHKEKCNQCKNNPWTLCTEGRKILYDSVGYKPKK